LIRKRNLIYWKSYQYKKANIEDILNWCNIFSDVNVGIVTGNISKLAVIYVDEIIEIEIEIIGSGLAI